MPSVPLFFIAKQISSMNIVGCLVAADGTITEDAASSANLKALGIFDRLEVTFDPGVVELSATGALMRNYMDETQDFNGTLSALDKNGKINPLNTLAFFYSYFKITAAVTQMGAGGVLGSTMVLYVKAGTITTGYASGRNVSSMALHPCGILPTLV